MRFDWNSLLSDGHEHLFRDYSTRYFPPAEDLVRYLEEFAARYRLAVEPRTRVVRLGRDRDRFEVEAGDGRRWRARRLIAATGLTHPYLPPIPGIELAETYVDVTIDPEDFTGQRVLVIGKGNSAFETADNLVPTAALIHVASPRPIQMAWKTHFVGHLRAINNNLLDTYQLKSQNAVLDCTIERIERRDGRFEVAVSYSHAGSEQEVLVYDRVIACTGFRFDASIFDPECRPELTIDDRLPAQTSEWESPNVPGLYFAGVLTQVRDYKKATSAFIHGFRYNARALWRMLECKYHDREWPNRELDATPEALLEALVGRINQTSALWQQFGFLADLVVVEGGTARYYEELPVAYVHDGVLGGADDYWLLTLEFGKITGDPFNIERKPEPGRAAESTFLHPVLRHYSGDRLLAEHHVLENLYGEWWDEALHVEPLRATLVTGMEDRDSGGERRPLAAAG
jgi:thioredoxin reductase